MKTRNQIALFLILVLVRSISVLYASQLPHYSLEIQGMNDKYYAVQSYSFYYTLSGFGNTCGFWLVTFPNFDGNVIHKGEVVDCIGSTNMALSYDSRDDSRIFTSLVPKVKGKYNVTVHVEKIKKPVIHKFVVESSEEPEIDRRRIGWTPAFEYHRVQINGTTTFQICSMLNIMCPENPVFHAVNRHDKNHTYFHYELPDKEYLVIIDNGKVCYGFDDIFEDTGLFEDCVGIENKN